MRIQHNIMAMNSYRNYTSNTSALAKNLEKLSSGYRINRAGDDAAGLAISEKMRAQISGLKQAQSNAKSGINLVQTAEGALTEVHDMLNRMVTLADQSANGTYDNEVDRNNLQKEVEALQTEIDRIAKASNFNGINLLDGSMDSSATVGGEKIDISVTNVKPEGANAEAVKPSFSIDLDGYFGKGTGNTAAVFTLTVGGVNVDSNNVTVTDGGDVAAKDIAAAFNGKTVKIGDVTFTAAQDGATSKLNFTADIDPQNTADAKADFSVALVNKTGDFAADAGAKVDTATQVITAGKVAVSGGQATADVALTTDMVANGASLTIGNQEFKFDYESDTTAGTQIGVKDLLNAEGKIESSKLTEIANRITNAGSGNSVFIIGNDGGTLKLQSRTSDTTTDLSTEDKVLEQISAKKATVSGTDLTLQIGDTSDTFNQLTVSIQSMKTASLGIDTVNISTQDGAARAVKVIKNAINTVSSVRGDLGATQNRLEHTINNLSVMTENIQDAEATIRDVDVAEEMMAYTKNNILVQSAQAMLAQANQVPQGVLQLLQ